MYLLEIDSTEKLIPASQTFYTVCAANAAALGLTAANLTEINSAVNGLSGSYAGALSAKEAAKAATKTKDLNQKNLKGVLSKWAKTFHANQTVPDALLTQLQLPPHNTDRTNIPPTQPVDAVVKANAQAFVTLKWKRNGNPTGTVFIIEAQTATGGAWTQIGAVTPAKFEYQATLGAFIGFRIVASRGKLKSQPSEPVYLWAGDDSGAGSVVALKVA